MFPVYYLMCALVLIPAAIFVVRGNLVSSLSTFFIFLLMFVPSIVKEHYRLHLPFAIHVWIIVFIYLTLFLGEVARLYESIPLWDKFLHFQSGFLLGASGFILLYMLNEHEKIKLGLSPGFVAVFAITFSIAIGVVWEILEFIGDWIFGSAWQANNTDTMWDLIADGGGALIISIIGYFWMYRHKKLPFTPWKIIKERFKK